MKLFATLLGAAAAGATFSASIANNTLVDDVMSVKGSTDACNTLSGCHACALAGCDFDASATSCSGTGSQNLTSSKFFTEARKCKDTSKICQKSTNAENATVFNFNSNITVPAGYFCLWNQV